MTALPETGREIPADELARKVLRSSVGYTEVVDEILTALAFNGLEIVPAARLASLEAERAKTVEECAKIVEALKAGEIRFGSRDLEDGWRAGYEAAIDTAADAIRALASEKGQADG